MNGQRYRQSLTTRDWREAQAREKELIARASQGKLLRTSQQFSRLNITDAMQRYLEDRAAHVQPKSQRSESDHAKPLREYFGSVPIGRIDADSVLAYIRQRKAKGLSNTTVNMEIGILRRILKRAKRWHFVGPPGTNGARPSDRTINRARLHGMDEAEFLIKAVEERLWTHTVGIINRAVERRGPDPLGSAMQGIQYGDPGTAFAGVWGKHHFLGTAKHVLEEAEVKDLLFFSRNVGDLRKESASKVSMENVFEPVSLRDKTAVIHRCEWDDLAIITTASDALGEFVEFFDVPKASSDPAENDVLVGMGYPTLSSLVFQRTANERPH